MASRKQETLARTEAWLLNADGTAQPAVLRHVDTSELTKDDPASHPSTSHPMERADGWTYLGRAPPVKWQNVPPGRGVWYEEGERDVIKATFVWSEAKQRHVWDLERVVERPVARLSDTINSATLSTSTAIPSRLRRIASRIGLGGLENVRPSGSSRAPNPSPSSRSHTNVSRPSSRAGSSAGSSPLLPQLQSHEPDKISGGNTPHAFAVPSARNSPTKRNLAASDSVAMSGLGIKAPKIRDQSIASPQESIEPPVERVFRDLRPKGEAKLYITIPLTPQRSMTVLALDDTSAVAGTLQCLVEELLQPLFVVAHEANYYFRQLLAGGLTYQYRIVLFRHLVEHYSNAGEKRRWHILSLLGEWMRIHSEDFEKGSQLHEYLCAFHYDAIQEALTRGLSKDEVGRIKGQQAELRQMNQVQAVYKQVAVAQHQMLFHPSSINQVFGSRIIADKPPCILGILNVRLVAQYLAAVNIVLFRHGITARNIINSLRMTDRRASTATASDEGLAAFQRRALMITHWTMVEILFPRTAAQRAVIIAHFIDLAAFLLNNGDAETTLNIITALTDSKARIRSSWAMLEDTHSQSLASTTNLLTDFKAYMNFVYSYKRPVVQVCSGSGGLLAIITRDWKLNHQPFVRPGSGDPSAPKDECIPASAILPYPLDNGVELADFIELLPVRGALARVEEARGRCKKVHDFGTLSRSAFVFGMFEPVLGSIPGSGTAWNPREPKVNLVLDEMSEMVEKGIMLAWELTSDTWSVGDANQRTRQQAAVAKLSAAAAWQELKYEHSPEVIFESKRVKAAAAAAAEARRMEEEAAMEAGEVEEAREIGEAEELGEMEETRETEEAEAVTDAEGVDQSAVGVAGIGLSGGARVGAGSVAREPGNESWLAEQRARSRTLSSVLEEE